MGQNEPAFASPGYNGAGSCLLLSQLQQQSVTVNTPPFLNMSFTSFTVEVWIYANTLYNNDSFMDNTIFGQFQQNTSDHSLYLTIRNQRIYFGFFDDDIQGNQVSDDNQELKSIW
ncbi:unnamed protein product [Rotaria sp. Silwood2]|nr:unnamed protein product [Rotaria sp. Silwood2]CAF4636260.1 unnamed protein product [Rotaria sp. Silwood2]